MRRRVVEASILGACFVGLAVWWLWPMPAVWRTHSPIRLGESAGADPLFFADYYLIVWALAWDSHALVTSPWSLFHANAFFPSTNALAYSEHFLGYVPLFAPTFWATGNAVFATNVLIFLTYPLCALAMYALARRFVGGPAAAVAGFFFAFSITRLEAPPHLHMLGVQYLPLAILATERWLARARYADAVLLGGSLLLQLLSSAYLAYGLLLVYVPYFGLAMWRWAGELDRRRLIGLAAAGGAALAVTGLAMVPSLGVRAVGLIPSYREDSPPLGWVFGFLRVQAYLAKEGVGWVGYALAAIALLPPWRRGLRWMIVIGLAVALVGTLSAFGTRVPIAGRSLWSPYALLVAWVPGFATVRLPARFVVMAHGGFALLAGAGAARLLDRRSARVAWPAAAALAVAALWSYAPYRTFTLKQELTGARVPEVYRWLAEHGERRAIFEIPAEGAVGMARRMYFSTYHWLPLVDGYSGYFPKTAEYVQRVASSLPAEHGLQELVDWVDVGWLVVHGAQLSPGAWSQWLGPLPPGLERVGTWGRDILLRVNRPVQNDRRARLLSTTETLGGVPLRPLGPACPGTLRFIGSPPGPWRSSRPATVRVLAENTGTVPWPAAGLLPRHLVELTAVLSTPDGRPLQQSKGRLSADVPPGGRAEASATLAAPFFPGEYRLEVALRQVMDGPLAACGVAPLVMPVHVE